MDVYELAEAINRDFETLVKNFGYGTIDPLIKNVFNCSWIWILQAKF